MVSRETSPTNVVPVGGIGVGSEVDLETGAMGHGPEAVARLDAGTLSDGRVVFVSGAAPNERVRARVTDVRGSFLRADVVAVLRPSPDRREAPCRHARSAECGGCPWQHLEDGAQRREKEALIQREAARACPGVTVLPIRQAVASFGYRRRARFGYRNLPGELVLGYRARATHRLFDVKECPVLDPDLETALPRFRGELPAGSGNIDAMVRAGGEAILGAAASPFAQPSAAAESALVACALSGLPPVPGHVIELFAGAGTFTVPLLAAGYTVDAYEGDPATVERLRRQAPSARAVRSNLLADGMRYEFGRADIVLLDPPRAGALPCLDSIAATGARTVIYVSCAPMTLFRDLRRLRELGFGVDWVQPFDAFPQTFHVECVARLTRP